MNRMVRCCAGMVLLSALGCQSVYMKGTPLYTGEDQPKGPPENRVNLWPLVYYREPSVSVLWPLMESTNDHLAARPLFSVYKLDKPKHEWSVLWPLSEFDSDSRDYWIFPFIWGDDYFVVFPEVWWFKDTKGVFPVFWWKAGATVFPLAWYEKGEHCHFFPLWLYTMKPDGKDAGGFDAHVAWPIFRVKRTEAEKGFRLWPLVGDYKSKDMSYAWALWPLCHAYAKGDERTRVAFPLYFSHSEKDRAWWLVVPVAFHSRDGQDSVTMTPIWSAGSHGDVRWSALMPLYYRAADPETKTSSFFTLLVGRAKSPEATTWIVPPLLSSVSSIGPEKSFWLVGPLAHARWGGDNTTHQVLPLYYYNRNRGMLLTPLVSQQTKPGEEFFNVLGLLAHYQHWPNGEKAYYLLPPLMKVSANQQPKKLRVLPLFAWERSKSSTPAEPDRGLGAAQHKDYSLWILPWMWFEGDRSTREPAPGKPEAPAGTRFTTENGFFPFWRYGNHRDSEAGKHDADFRILGWLYDYRVRESRSKDDPAKTDQYVRSRVLWRLMHYERTNGDRSLDLFPFITWDRKADGYHKSSFLWRFYRYERTPDRRYKLDLLFLPVFRAKLRAPQPPAPPGFKPPA